MELVSKSNSNEPQYVDLNTINLNLNNMKMLPKDFMFANCLIPIQVSENDILIAMGNPSDNKAIENAEFLLKKTVKAIPAKKEQIYTLINDFDDVNKTTLVIEQLKHTYETRTNFNQVGFNEENIISLESSPIVMIANSIINQAINMKASDIHMEPFQNEAIIRFRVDGILNEHRKIPMDIYLTICSRIKVQANMDIAEKRCPQDGKYQFNCKNIVYDLRISTLPTIYGEKIVMRILYKKEKLQNLESLGFDTEKEESILDILKGSHGIILVTGPTGSGKTTTLYAMLEEIDKDTNNIVTVEDPVEIEIPRINQVNVNNKAGLTFSNGLRNILRQDPNVIMIGEIRDEETAQMAVRAAITGHLVISTLHTNDAASSVIRLIDMGVPNYLVADSLISCIAQRLVRRICSFCKEEYSPTIKQINSLNLNSSSKLYRGKGCVLCNNTGYKGRTVVYEIMHLDNATRMLICDGKGVDDLRIHNKSTGMSSLKDNCVELMKAGITTYEEFIRVCGSK